LLELIRQKNIAQYSGKPMSRAMVTRILKQAERFIEWAGNVLPASA
jgi:hypothetical protein